MIAGCTRTNEEIVAHIEEIKDNDVLGFEQSDLIGFLDYEHAKPFLNDGVTNEEWVKSQAEEQSPKSQMVEYMDFAFGKAHGERGISANRSISHMMAWSWLSGDDALYSEIRRMCETEYSEYGLPILRMICERLGIDPKEFGDC